MERERLEKEKLEKERLEKEKLEKEKQERERIEKEKQERERLEKEKQERERLEKEKQERERVEKERIEKEILEKETHLQVKTKSPEEEKRANIFEGICPHCKKKSEEMKNGNIRKCNNCGYVYDILNNFKEYNPDEWKRTNLLNNKCPKCLQNRYSDDNNISIKCFACNIVYDMKNNNKEYSIADWQVLENKKKERQGLFEVLTHDKYYDISIDKCPFCKGILLKIFRNPRCEKCKKVFCSDNINNNNNNNKWRVYDYDVFNQKF
jgi:hypothetical protein